MDNYIEEILKKFSVLGNRLENYGNGKFVFCLVSNWETPSFSPNLLLPDRNFTKDDLQYVEECFSEFEWNNKAVKQVPYFNFVKNSLGYDYQRIKQICDDNGWYVEPEPLRINFLRNPMKIELPEKFNYSIIRVNNGSLPKEYKHTVKQNFNADQDYIGYIEAAFRQIDTYIAMVKTASGECAAGGAVSFRNNTGFMTWGSVNKAYRNQGIHQALLAIIRKICDDVGVESCAYTTRNQFIINKCDDKIKMMICRKSVT